MAKIDITRTELVWPGKYDDEGSAREIERVSLPFQVIETINESRATREAAKKPKQPSLFDVWQAEEGETFEEGWKNKLIWGENKLVMSSLRDAFAGKFDLIYIDPPFATGADFSLVTHVGEEDLELAKEPSLIEEKTYRDTWGAGYASYLTMMAERLRLMLELLSSRGSLFVHCDWHVSYLLRGLLNEIFGEDNFLNEIIWYYYNKFQGNVNRFASNHDVVLWYRRSADFVFYPQKEQRDEPIRQLKRTWDKETGRIVNVKGPDGKAEYILSKEKTVDDVWRIPMLQPADKTQNTGFQTQKPQAIAERIILSTTDPGMLVGDFFCGSGTTMAVAEKHGRRWIGCDLSRWATHVSRKRLLGIEDCKPFEVLNLGKYERKYWQAVTFGDKDKTDQELAIYQYIAFILKLYGAEPLSGTQHLHGKQGKAVAHIGAVDAPVTIDEINACLDECLALKLSELHVLGWEWEMGLNDLMVNEAKSRGVKLLLLTIPREVMEEQAVEKGDIQFFELAYLRADVLVDGRAAVVSLEDFVIPNTELIPEDVRDKVTKWSDYIDYWAIDWDFQNDTFMNGWVAYRTRKNRKLTLTSDPHTYEKPGKYTVMVKVIDIFGNDTTQAFEVEVK